MKKELSKAYQANDREDKIYEKWEKSGYFNPDNLDLPENAENYTIILPPPNITAKLHLGHSAMLAIEDLMIRYKRLKGFRTLWLPGTDHAAIATQNVVEKQLLAKIRNLEQKLVIVSERKPEVKRQVKVVEKVVEKVVKSAPKRRTFVGANTSMKLHSENCPFAKNIKKENKVTFKTKLKAFNNNYTPCKCLA